jgi:hypothetical protein
VRRDLSFSLSRDFSWEKGGAQKKDVVAGVRAQKESGVQQLQFCLILLD